MDRERIEELILFINKKIRRDEMRIGSGSRYMRHDKRVGIDRGISKYYEVEKILNDALKREDGCEYCNVMNPRQTDVPMLSGLKGEGSIYEMTTGGNGGMNLYFDDEYGHHYCVDLMHFKYCPYCGRPMTKLEGNKMTEELKPCP